MFAASCLLLGACSSAASSGSDGTGSGSGARGGGGGASASSGATTSVGSGGATGVGGGGATGAGSGGEATAAGGGGATGSGGSGTGGAEAGSGQGAASGAGGGAADGGTGGNVSAGGTGNSGTPTLVSGRYQFTFGDVVFEIAPEDGGRVSKLALAGADLIVPSGTDPTTWGSVFWTSPRSDWTPELWPPPAAMDNDPYTGSISGDHVVVSGPTDAGLGVSMTKDYAVDASSGWISIEYTINATEALSAAPWEVSRVPRGGIVFFPVGSSLTPGPLTITQSSGIAWFDDASASVTSPDGDKCAADGAGWTAYAVGGNLFLKKFADQPASAQAPGEGEVDIYPGDGFLEFEVQGPYTPIAAAGKLSWNIEWRVIEIPGSVTIGVDSTTLVDFAEQQLAE